MDYLLTAQIACLQQSLPLVGAMVAAWVALQLATLEALGVEQEGTL
jgi:hypothetical protein